MRMYETSYSNEVHQLLITPSRHLYVLKDGRVKFQKRMIEGGLQESDKNSKDQIIHYILRDHFSLAMYAEIHTRAERVSIEQFLWNAWSKKNEYPFCGLPDFLILPKAISSAAIDDFIHSLHIDVIRPTGGFMAGVRIFGKWDQVLNFVYSNSFDPLRSFQELQSKVLETIQIYFESDPGLTERINVWQSNLRNLRLPPPQNEFFKLYKQTIV